MYWAFTLVFLAVLRCSAADPTIRGSVELDPHGWTTEHGTEVFKMMITVNMQYPVRNGWRMALIFSQPVKKVEVWRAEVIQISADKKIYALKNKNFNPLLTKRKELTMAVVAYTVNKGSKPDKIIVLFKGGNVIPALPTLPPPTTPPPIPKIPMYLLQPIDKSDSHFKMIIKYQVPKAVKYWSISLKFTKNISTTHFNIDNAKVALQKEPTSDSFCFRPQDYNRNLKADSFLLLEFSCSKATMYEAAPNAFFVFHPNSRKCKDFDLPWPAIGPATPQERPAILLTQQWPLNNFKMRFDIQVINSVRGGWKITIKFSKPVAEIFDLNAAKVDGKSKDQLTYIIENFPGQIQNANLKQCEKIKIEFAGRLVRAANLTASALLKRKEPEYAEVNPQGACPPPV